MTLAQSLAAELLQEAATTRRLLERVPEQHFAWKPHPKSMSMGQLAHHIATLPLGIAQLLTERVAAVPDVPLPEPASRDELLTKLENSVAFAAEKLAVWGDEGLAESWSMTREGAVLLELPRGAMFRSVMLNHWYHHRGQLTVYLRMHDVPLPSTYGPTADEKPFR